MSRVLIDRLLDDAFSVLQHDTGEQDEEYRWQRDVLREKFSTALNRRAQPAEADGDRIASGMVILDGMAFSKEEILRQRKYICEAMEQLLAVTAERDALRPIHAMILNALDRDAEEGKAVRGEMAAELRAAMAAKEG